MSKPKQDPDEIRQKEYIFVYFIENHIKSEDTEVALAETYNEAGDLEVGDQKDIESNADYKYTIYRFKIYIQKVKENAKKKIEIKIKLKNNAGNQFVSQIKIENKDFEMDNFIYDLKFEKPKDLEEEIKPPNSINLNHIQQFDIYVEYLRKKINILQSSKVNADFIFSTQKLLIGPTIKYQFSFYLMIFLECFATKYIQRFLILFKPSKIEEIGILPSKKQKTIASILNMFLKNPNRVLNNINDQKKKK